MPDRTLAIVFRNPHPQRSPVRTKLYLLRSDGGSLHTDYPHQGSIDPNRAGAARLSGSARCCNRDF
jgi:hypothetical protein